MKPLPLNALRAFALVHAHGGVRAAARELDISHSAVSRHLVELETWIGVPLVERSTRRWTPTPQGAALARRLQELFRKMDDATEAARESGSPFSVTIAAAPSFACHCQLLGLLALARDHQRIALSDLMNQSMDMPTDVIDLAVRMGAWAGRRMGFGILMYSRLYPIASSSCLRPAGGGEVVDYQHG